MNFVKNDIWRCEFCEKWYLKMWILWKNEILKCEFCEKWDFKNVNFVKNVFLKLWILSKNEILKMWIFGWIANFCPSVSLLPFCNEKTKVISSSLEIGAHLEWTCQGFGGWSISVYRQIGLYSSRIYLPWRRSPRISHFAIL